MVWFGNVSGDLCFIKHYSVEYELSRVFTGRSMNVKIV